MIPLNIRSWPHVDGRLGSRPGGVVDLNRRYLFGVAVFTLCSHVAAAEVRRTVTPHELVFVLSTFAVLVASAASLLSGVFKILVLGKFRLDTVWFAYGVKTARHELSGATLSNAQRVLRIGYLLTSYLATATPTLGVLGFAWIFLAY
jgi:hypothetical protein